MMTAKAPVMMKISDEAVEAVAKALNPDLFSDDEDSLLHPALRNSGRWQKRHEVRAALQAAAPYLEPAGDGGLREALKELAQQRDAVSGHTPGDYTIRPYELFDLIAAHPAAPAVPQPVDREALREQIAEALAVCACAEGRNQHGYWRKIDMDCPACGTNEAKADAVLALLGGSVLAGEQEQVAPE